MTIAESRADRSVNVGGCPSALMAKWPEHAAGCPSWSAGFRCDLVVAPVADCGGVIAHLVRADLAVCPVARVGDWMVFLAAEGSLKRRADLSDGLSQRISTRSAVDRFPADLDTRSENGCWVIPPDCVTPILPSAESILSALRSAYAEYTVADAVKII